MTTKLYHLTLIRFLDEFRCVLCDSCDEIFVLLLSEVDTLIQRCDDFVDGTFSTLSLPFPHTQ